MRACQKMTRYILYIFSMFVTLSGCNKHQIIAPVNKPDLIIEKITYLRQQNCWEDPHGGVVCSGIPMFQFNLKIKNIGDADLDQSFYISNSRSNKDFQSVYCPHTTIVNYPPTDLRANEFIDVTFNDFVNDSTAKVLFVINTNDLFSKGRPLPKIDEQRYDNNSYILDFKW